MKYVIEQAKQWFNDLNIVSMILGSLFTFLVTKAKQAISTYIDKRRYNKIASDKILLAPDTVESIAHSTPWYEENNINIYDGHKSFYLKPEGIDSINEDFPFNQEVYFDKTYEQLLEIIHQNLHVEINELKRLIEETKIEVVKDVEQSIKDGFELFNGKMCGIERISTGSKLKLEDPKTNIAFYTTDFYTHRVMNKLYRKLINDERYEQYFPEKWHCQDINRLYPFFTSIGVDALLFIHLDLSDIVITKRSKILPNMKAKNKSLWHLSMNEAVIPSDLSFDRSKLSLRSSVVRGLKEELGIDIEVSNDNQVKFGDFFFVKDLCEVGVTCVATIPYINFEEVKQKAQIAKDENEHVDIKILKPNELKNEIKQDGENYTEACKYTAAMLLERYEEISKFAK